MNTQEEIAYGTALNYINLREINRNEKIFIQNQKQTKSKVSNAQPLLEARRGRNSKQKKDCGGRVTVVAKSIRGLTEVRWDTEQSELWSLHPNWKNTKHTIV